MRSIGIISLYGRFNYGNRLQNYATYKICENEGFFTESLVLTKAFHLRRDAKRLIKKILGRPEPLRQELFMDPCRLAAFDRFNDLIPIRFFDHIDRDLCDKYTYFIVGSDQVWNPRFFSCNEDWFFLRFAAKKQRIALSPSIGVDRLTPVQQLVISNGIKGFSRVSVREDKGAELIRRHAGVDASVICDPTLVISTDEWLKIMDNRLTPATPYVFTYILGESSAPYDVLAEVTKHEKIPIVSLTDRDGYGELPAGPAEFLSLIANASHVLTDSFHASLFSAMFQVPLTIVRRSGGSDMFSRIESLARKLGIEDKIYGSSSFDLGKASIYNEIPGAIAHEREVFMRYFRGSIGA